MGRGNLTVTAARTGAAIACMVMAVACGGGAQPAHNHGRVVAHLTIPFTPAIAPGKPDVIRVTVARGTRFSVLVDTSDGPIDWSQTSAPNPHLLRLAGNFDDGSCAAGLAGCRVPYFHTLIARAPGATTMSWKYNELRCEASPPPVTGPMRCPKLTTVTFDITVR